MMRGKLLKRSNLLHTWKTRTFELDTELLVRTLRYYDSNGKMKGEFVLNGKQCVIQLLDEVTAGRQHCFALSSGGRTLIMSAGSDSAMRKWVDFLEKNGAKLIGAEDVEQQELWRSVMKAEEQMKHEQDSSISRKFVEQLSQSAPNSDVYRSSVSGFSESSPGQGSLDVDDSDTERIDDIFTPPTPLTHGKFATIPDIVSEPMATYRNSSDMETMDALAAQVHKQLMDMGMTMEYLPSRSAVAKCQIFLSEDWSVCDKLIVFVGNSHGGGGGRSIPPGIWSRSCCSTLGVENGSMLAYLERCLAGGYGSIVLDTSTHTNLVEVGGILEKITVKGSETAEKHMSTVWDKYISHAQAQSLFVIAYGLGGESFKEFLESHTNLLFSSKTPCLKAVALLESSHKSDSITQMSVRRFLRQRAVNWEASNLPRGQRITGSDGDIYDCVRVSAGEQAVDSGSSNRAWIIPVVKDSVFRFLDFCVDVDDFQDAGGNCSERWAKMESRSSWS